MTQTSRKFRFGAGGFQIGNFLFRDKKMVSKLARTAEGGCPYMI
jgi:hypothetical protein